MNNKIIIGIIIALVVIGGIAYFFTHTQTQTNPGSGSSVTKNEVTIQNMAFSPATLSVKVGDKVTWTNQDSVAHTATADDNSFDTGTIAQGQSGSFTFTKAGTYTYHCSIHPNMTATIIVQ